VDCPANQECFASTPCTLSPSNSPTISPTPAPSKEPTPRPTNAPWSDTDWVAFLFGEKTNDSVSGVGGGDGGGRPSSVSSPSGLASEVKEELQNYVSFQYHFFCGISWTHADETCDTFCPSGDKDDCPMGEECYANT